MFNLILEEGDSTDVPEFYLYAVTDLNGRTTYVVNGMLVFDYASCWWLCIIVHMTFSGYYNALIAVIKESYKNT